MKKKKRQNDQNLTQKKKLKMFFQFSYFLVFFEIYFVKTNVDIQERHQEKELNVLDVYSLVFYKKKCYFKF
jgi:hypothetical protein